MSKEFNNIDELFKAELGGSSAKAPAHVKANIDKAIGFGGKRRLLWVFIPLALLLMVSPLLYQQFSSQEATDDLTSTNTKNSSSSAIEEVNMNSDLNKEFTGGEKVSHTDQTNDSEDFSIPPSDQNKLASVNTNSSSNNASNLNINSNSNNNTNTNTNGISTADIPALDNKASNNTDDKLIVYNIIDSNDNKNTLADNDNKTLIPDHNHVLTSTTKTDSIGNNLITDVNNLDQGTTIPSIDSSDASISNNPIMDSTYSAAIELDSTLESPDSDIDKPEEDYKPWILSATAGINMKKSNLTVPNLGDSANYFHDVNDKIGHSAQIELAYRLKNSLTFGGGIGYTSLIENYII